MGDGGTVLLLNGTKYDWIRVSQQSASMNSWYFPPLLRSGGLAPQYVEFQYTGSPQSGTTRYALNGSGGASFELRATNSPDYRIQVALESLAASGRAAGSVVELGWRHYGCVSFLLYGEDGKFGFSTLPVDWMHDTLPFLGERTLRQLCIGGSHDSGMSVINASTVGGNACNTVTQAVTVLGQLQAGARFFDIRPVISKGIFQTGHYTDTGNSLLKIQGATGQSIRSIIDDLNAFTTSNAELIILYLSGDMVTDLSYQPFNQEEYGRLMEEMTRINYLFVTKAADLTKLKLSTFIGNGKAAVVVIVDAKVELGRYATRGFYPASSFPMINDYANTPDLQTMMADQYGKLVQHRKNPDSPYFVLSWTLTQTEDMAKACSLTPTHWWDGNISAPKSLLRMAAEANPALTPTLIKHCTSQVFPNVLYTDNVLTPALVTNAMSVNCLSTPGTDPRTSPPLGLVATSAGLSVFYRRPDLRIAFATARDGRAWGAPVALPPTIYSAFAPAVTAWNGTIAMLYRGVPQELTLWAASEASHWTDLKQLPPEITSLATPALAVLNNTLYGVYLTTGGDARMFVLSSSGIQGWRIATIMPPPVTTNFAPSAAVLNNTLYVLFRSSGDLMMYLTSSIDGVHWGNPARVENDQSTFWSPSLVAFRNDLHAVYRSSSDLAVWITRRANDGWRFKRRLPEVQTLYSPAAAVMGDTLHVLYTSATDYTVWQTTSLDGDSWTPPVQLPGIVLGP